MSKNNIRGSQRQIIHFHIVSSVHTPAEINKLLAVSRVALVVGVPDVTWRPGTHQLHDLPTALTTI